MINISQTFVLLPGALVMATILPLITAFVINPKFSKIDSAHPIVQEVVALLS